MSVPAVEPFFLVGGTALALQMGHRVSVDLDLFTPHDFDKDNLLESLNAGFDLAIESERAGMVITYVNGVKVDFVKMGYPVLFPSLHVEGVRMLDLRDIAPMKLKAIAQRGSKKDFFDIYFLLQHISLATMLHLFKEKFQQQEIFHIVKSLTYFEDAEQYADPTMFDQKVTWSIVKSKMKEAVKKLV